mgnify:CR=1 FL=1
MNKRIPLGITLALMMVTAAITVTITMVMSQQKFDEKLGNINERRAMYAKISEIETKVRENYFGEIDETELMDMVAGGFIAGIGDKYSTYLTAAQTTELNSEISGKATGVGLRVTKAADGNIYVYQVMNTSPAQTAGLQKGDVVIRVGDSNVTDIGYQEATKLLSGEVGTTVNLTVRRGEEELSFTLTRATYENYTVSAGIMSGIGIVKIDEFNNNTDEQFIGAVEALLAQEPVGLVFDLRGNTGGTLESVCAMLDYLLPAGDVVSRTDNTGTHVIYTSDDHEIDIPMTVLVNEKTASAAELFACALRDYGKAQLVGTTTYGKGSIQNLFTLSDGSSINLTVARFNPPKSENFEGVGLTPDVEVALTEEEQANFYFMSPMDDPQLKKAMELLNPPVPTDYVEVPFSPAPTYVPTGNTSAAEDGASVAPESSSGEEAPAASQEPAGSEAPPAEEAPAQAPAEGAA